MPCQVRAALCVRPAAASHGERLARDCRELDQEEPHGEVPYLWPVRERGTPRPAGETQRARRHHERQAEEAEHQPNGGEEGRGELDVKAEALPDGALGGHEVKDLSHHTQCSTRSTRHAVQHTQYKTRSAPHAQVSTCEERAALCSPRAQTSSVS